MAFRLGLFRLEKLTFGTAGYYVIKILWAWQNVIGLLCCSPPEDKDFLEAGRHSAPLRLILDVAITDYSPFHRGRFPPHSPQGPTGRPLMYLASTPKKNYGPR